MQKLLHTTAECGEGFQQKLNDDALRLNHTKLSTHNEIDCELLYDCMNVPVQYDTKNVFPLHDVPVRSEQLRGFPHKNLE